MAFILQLAAPEINHARGEDEPAPLSLSEITHVHALQEITQLSI